MRNCPSWVLAYMGVVKAGAIATLLNGWWEPAEMEHAILLTEPKLMIADGSRGDASPSDARPARSSAWMSAAAEAGARALLSDGHPRRPARGRSGGRCDHSFHLGVDGRLQRRGFDAPRCHDRHLLIRDRADRVAGTSRTGRPPAEDAAHPAQRPVVPCHRRSAGHAQQLRHRTLHGDHAEMGRGRGASADRERADHLFRRRADHEPRAHEPSRSRQI